MLLVVPTVLEEWRIGALVADPNKEAEFRYEPVDLIGVLAVTLANQTVIQR